MLIDRRSFFTGLATFAGASLLLPGLARAAEGPFTLEPLPYPADANEPHIDALTMEIHHGRHHKAYVDNLNAVADELGPLAERPLHEILERLDEVPEEIRTRVRNNGGGHANHAMFWEIMGGEGGAPEGELLEAIERHFGDFDSFRADFDAAGRGVFGSGWVFVTVDEEGRLAIETRPNQDTPLMDGARVLMGNDVWEHAYYLQYQNRRADYLEAWWNVLDWTRIAERYAAARDGSLTI